MTKEEFTKKLFAALGIPAVNVTMTQQYFPDSTLVEVSFDSTTTEDPAKWGQVFGINAKQIENLVVRQLVTFKVRT